jgi:hypothetical protein
VKFIWVIVAITGCSHTQVGELDAGPHRLAASGIVPITPASWNVTQWYVDPQNTSGTARDANDCISITTPCVHFGEIAVHRWLTYSPILPAPVTVTFLSSQNSPWADDPVYWTNNLSVVGTLATQTTVAIGTFTPKNRGAGTANTITASGQGGSFWAPYVGSFAADVSSGAVFWIEKDLGSATARITEPVQPNPSGNLPTTYVAIANGDSLTLSLPVAINCTGSDAAIVGTASMFHVWCRNTSKPSTTGYVSINESRVSSYLFLPLVTDPTNFILNSYLDGFTHLVANVFSGAIAGSFPSIGGNLNGDVLIDPATGFHLTSATILNRAYIGSGSVLDTDSRSMLYISAYDGPVWYPDNEVWGPAGLDVHDGATLVCEQSCASQLLLTGALTMHGSTTALPWVAATRVWGAAATITPAAIDAAGAMCDPATGDCFRH